MTNSLSSKHDPKGKVCELTSSAVFPLLTEASGAAGGGTAKGFESSTGGAGAGAVGALALVISLSRRSRSSTLDS